MTVPSVWSVCLTKLGFVESRWFTQFTNLSDKVPYVQLGGYRALEMDTDKRYPILDPSQVRSDALPSKAKGWPNWTHGSPIYQQANELWSRRPDLFLGGTGEINSVVPPIQTDILYLIRTFDNIQYSNIPVDFIVPKPSEALFSWIDRQHRAAFPEQYVAAPTPPVVQPPQVPPPQPPVPVPPPATGLSPLDVRAEEIRTMVINLFTSIPERGASNFELNWSWIIKDDVTWNLYTKPFVIAALKLYRKLVSG